MSQPGHPEAFGRYQVVEELGRGAMGDVFLCVDPRLTRPVAIKALRLPAAARKNEREEYLARFFREAEAAGRLQHPGIVQLYDVGDGWLVMEFVEGRTLAQKLHERSPLPAREVARIVRETGEALHYAHDRGVVHRDIKPANLMLDEAGHVKIMDFGVARLSQSSDLTAAGVVVGSVRYMAPEQMLGKPVDRRADVFALGAVAYEALTGRPPFPGRSVTEVVARVVQGGHVPPRRVDPRLPPAADDVFAKVFAVDPGARFGDASTFARELGLVLATMPAEDPRSTDATLVVAAPDETTDTKVKKRGAPADATVIGGAKPAAGLDGTIAAPLPTGVLYMDSEPSGARIQLDGVPAGVTPASLVVALGRHLVRVELDGRSPAIVEVDVRAGSPLRAVSVSLPVAARPGDVQAGQFVPFGPGVTPPRRVRGHPPAYPEAARKSHLEGAPIVDVWVSHTGEVSDVALVESAGGILDQALLEAVAGWRFEPATVRGVPVSTRMTVQHVFRR